MQTRFDFNFFCCFLGFVVLPAFGQTNAIVADKNTHKALKFVNIWNQDLESLSHSDSLGYFHISSNSDQNTLGFNAVGYEIKTKRVSEIKDTVFLKPVDYSLKEVVLEARRNKRKLTLNKIKKKDINYYGASSTKQAWIVAHLIPFQESFHQFPFLSKISVFTFALESKDFEDYNIRIYEVAENGQPGNSLCQQNLIIYPEKRSKRATLDINKLNIKIPENGFFIGIESMYNTNKNASNALLGFCANLKFSKTYFFKNGTWVSRSQRKATLAENLSTSSTICIEIEVSD
jgi:hypothetical protein